MALSFSHNKIKCKYLGLIFFHVPPSLCRVSVLQSQASTVCSLFAILPPTPDLCIDWFMLTFFCPCTIVRFFWP